MSINKVMITGNLTRDPELKASQSGTQILTFGVAVNDRRRNQAGNWEDKANFVDCVVFGNRADALNRFLSKGSKVAIEGRLSYSSWESNGQRRSKLEVIVDDLEFMSRNDGGNNGNAGGYQQPSAPYSAPQPSAPAPAPQAPAPAAPAPVPSAPQDSVVDTDIPF